MEQQAKTILIVDSDEDMCWLLKKVLKTKNCHIMVSHIMASESWEKVLYLVSQKKPDLVLLDMPLSNISPVNILRFIKDSQPNTPVIIITPCVSGGLTSQIRELDNNCKFIIKPFVIENLIMTVKQALCLVREEV